jgi:hypothetical protein
MIETDKGKDQRESKNIKRETMIKMGKSKKTGMRFSRP